MMKLNETGEKCMMRNSIIFALTRIQADDQMGEVKMGWVCSMHGGDEK